MKTRSFGQIPPLAVTDITIPKMVGRSQACDIYLPDEMRIVSSRHAQFELRGNELWVVDVGSRNGTYLDGQVITEEVFKPGSKLQIGRYSIRHDQKGFLTFTLREGIRLAAQYLELIVKPNNRILNNVSLVIEPNSFVTIVGGSGAGKSTLLKVLNGLRSPSRGKVLINGKNLYSNFDTYRQRIGYVPQEDIVHRELTVEEVLYFSAQLRLAEDYTLEDLNQKITEALNTVELSHVRNKSVGALSGGQRKRVCIASELLSQPELFFLDEPTSGLDPGLDRKLMQLMSRLALGGRTVLLVTHATGSVSLCDRIIFMGSGGNLCFYGKPTELLQSFNLDSQNVDFTDIYDQLSNPEVMQQVSEQFKNSSLYQHYVQEPLDAMQQKTLPGITSNMSKPSQVSIVKQWWFLSQRYLTLLIKDRGNLALLLLQAPFIGLIITLVSQADVLSSSPREAEVPLFILVTSALWFGLLNSIREIVRERPIFDRERMAGVSVPAYILSKVTVLSLLAFVQTLSLTGVIFPVLLLNLPEVGIKTGLLLGTLFLTTLASSALGLMVSAFVPNPSWAISLAPLLLIPQLLFAGVLFPLKGGGTVLSRITQSKWSMDALGQIFTLNTLYNQSGDREAIQRTLLSPRMPADLRDRLQKPLANFDTLQKRTMPYPKPGFEQPVGFSWFMLAFFQIFFLVLTYLALQFR